MGYSSGAGLVLGGARSGKSGFAEQLAQQSLRQKTYIATSEIWDAEMENRVALHRSRRGADWQVVEETLDLCSTLEQHVVDGSCVLVDCLTLWLTNLMMAEKDVAAECRALVAYLAQLPQSACVLLVSNEVGQGIVPMEKMARDFRDFAGRLHQDIAAAVPHVWFVTAGLPQKLK